jgi:cytochrome c oxidase cbb3-type subunit 3
MSYNKIRKMKKLLKNIVVLSLSLLTTVSYGQDGQALFKAKCNTCHLLDKASTGPMLKGVKQKWEDAGEGELLFDWVTNSTGLIASGKSQMANAIKGFSPMEMPAQQVSKEEMKAILDYVDNPPVVAKPTDITTNTPVEVILKANYKENLVTFYWLIATSIALLIAIFILSTSISNLVKSDYFKKKIAEQENQKSENKSMLTILIFILSLGLSPSVSAMKFSAPGESLEKTTWILVENTDIYFMIVLNIILLFIVLYLRNMFKKLLQIVHTRKQKEKAPKVISKLNKVLTDVVPIEEEHTILMHHEYDGIRELDNNLPPWWVWGFFTTIIVAVIYLFNYHVFKTGDLQVAEYNKEMKKAETEVKAYLSKMAMNVDENNVTLMSETADLAKGKALFETNCVTCHNPKGEGNIGPNLTDKYWIYGSDIKGVFKTIKTGTPNGMPEHNSKFNPIQLQQVASFVLSLPEAKGKEPQGELIKD